MKIIEISTSGNLGAEWWQLHRVGCNDIKKVLGTGRTNGCYEIEIATDIEKYIADTIKELNEQDGTNETTGFNRSHWRVFPCCAKSEVK